MDTIQYLSLTFSIFSLALLVYWVKKDRKIVLYTVPAFTWLLHVVIFYITRMIFIYGHIDTKDIFLFTHWSSFLRFHSLFIFFQSILILSDFQTDFIRWIRTLWKTLLQKF